MSDVNKRRSLYNITGVHETQVSEGTEAQLHKCLISCTKNPGHKKFIPIESFSLEHLPERFRDNNMYEVMKLVADLTVRIDVKRTSPYRPEFWPNSNIAYPFYNIRCTEMSRLGSGRVYDVTKRAGQAEGADLDVHTSCTCHKCQQSGSPSAVWWEVDVLTAAHVIFDELEARSASCRLFYDTLSSPLVILDTVRVEDVNLDRDWCKVNCVTCDAGIVDKLVETRSLLSSMWMDVYEKYKETRDEDRLAFMVSHPHGCPKQISIGRWLHKHQFEDDFNKFIYNTCTCPGSSGATLHCVGYSGRWPGGYQLVHSGSSDSKDNFSGLGRVW